MAALVIAKELLPAKYTASIYSQYGFVQSISGEEDIAKYCPVLEFIVQDCASPVLRTQLYGEDPADDGIICSSKGCHSTITYKGEVRTPLMNNGSAITLDCADPTEEAFEIACNSFGSYKQPYEGNGSDGCNLEANNCRIEPCESASDCFEPGSTCNIEDGATSGFCEEGIDPCSPVVLSPAKRFIAQLFPSLVAVVPPDCGGYCCNEALFGDNTCRYTTSAIECGTGNYFLDDETTAFAEYDCNQACSSPDPEPTCGDGQVNRSPENCDQGNANGFLSPTKPYCCDGNSDEGGCKDNEGVMNACRCPLTTVPDDNGGCRCSQAGEEWNGIQCQGTGFECTDPTTETVDGKTTTIPSPQCIDRQTNDCRGSICCSENYEDDPDCVGKTAPFDKDYLKCLCNDSNSPPTSIAQCATMGLCSLQTKKPVCIDEVPNDNYAYCAACPLNNEECEPDASGAPVCCAPGACAERDDGTGYCKSGNSPNICTSNAECEGTNTGGAVCQTGCVGAGQQECMCNEGFCVNVLVGSCGDGGVAGGGGTPGGGPGGTEGGDTGGADGGDTGGSGSRTDGGDTGGEDSSASSEAVSSTVTSEVSSEAFSSVEISSISSLAFSSVVISEASSEAVSSSGFFSSIPEKLCGNGVVDEGEDCDNGSVCSQDEYRSCTSESDCNICAFVGTTDVARCGGVESGELCSKQSDCEDAGFTCDYDTVINPECSDQCTLPQASSEFVSSVASSVEASVVASEESSAVVSSVTVAFCGDGIIQANLGEECDLGDQNVPPGSLNAQCSCAPGDDCVSAFSGVEWTRGCRWPTCGDGKVNNEVIYNNTAVNNDLIHEECDDGNTQNGDGCSALCEVEIASSESSSSEITIIAVASSATSASSQVTIIQENDDDDDVILGGSNSCGNGSIERRESCDDGNRISGDGCSNRCITEDDDGDEIFGPAGGCGNGRRERTEECDDGNRTNGDGCDTSCEIETVVLTETPTIITPPPTLVAAASVCGNGILEGSEECDDRNRRDSDGCSSTCLLEIGICGDGIVQSLLGEQCEGDERCQNCRFVSPTCGDGVVDDKEECDNGARNSTAPNALCRPDCSLSRCGDSILDSTELCDDGNYQDNDGCDRFCRTEEVDPPEEPEETFVAGESVVQFPDPLPQVPDVVRGAPYQQQHFQFPQQPNYQQLPFQLPLAQLQPLIAPQGVAGETGPAAVAVGISGVAAGVGWMRRKKRK